MTSLEQLEAALPVLTDALRRHWSTGQGSRIRALVWSLYGGDHPVGLGYALSGLDEALGRAIGTVIRARIEAGAAIEEFLRKVLEDSGEMARFQAIADRLPDHLPVPYPPPELSARELRQLADALDLLHPET